MISSMLKDMSYKLVFNIFGWNLNYHRLHTSLIKELKKSEAHKLDDYFKKITFS